MTAKNFRRCSFLFFLIFSLKIYGQTVLPLSLEDAIALGNKHSKLLKSDSLQMRIAENKMTQAKNSIIPKLVLDLNYLRISDNITSTKIAFPSGEITLNPQILNQSFNSLQLRQLIWAGGKANYGIEISKKDIDATRFDIQKDKLDVQYAINSLWYNLALMKSSKKIIEFNISDLEAKKRDIVNFVNQGLAIENDALKLDLAVTNLQSNLNDITNTVSSLNFNLCTLTGLPTEMVIELPENFIEDLPLLNVESFQNDALSNRPELKGLNTRLEAAGIGLKIVNSNIFPTLSGIVSLNLDHPTQRIVPNKEEFSPTAFVGLNLNWNLSELYLNKNRVAETQYNIEKLKNVADQVAEGIRLEVNTNYTEYLQALEKIKLSKKSIAQAQENLRVEKNKLDATSTTPTDYLDANTKLLQAQLNLNSALITSQLAFKKLLKSVGTNK